MEPWRHPEGGTAGTDSQRRRAGPRPPTRTGSQGEVACGSGLARRTRDRPQPRAAAAPDPVLDEIAALYAANFWRFVRVATAITGNVETARDAVQDAFANLVRHRRHHRLEASLGAWAWRAVVNTARSHLRAAAYAERAAQRAGSLQERDNWSADPDRQGLEALLHDLSERQRLVVFLRYYADLDYASIADTLSIRVGTVGATLNAAHAALRASLPARP